MFCECNNGLFVFKGVEYYSHKTCQNKKIIWGTFAIWETLLYILYRKYDQSRRFVSKPVFLWFHLFSSFFFILNLLQPLISIRSKSHLAAKV